MEIRFSLGRRLLSHALAAPIFSAVGIYLWANLLGDGSWLFWRNMEAIQAADFYGLLAYPVVAGLYEVLAKTRDWIRQDGYHAGYETGYAEHQSAAIRSGRQEGKSMALAYAYDLSVTDEQKFVVQQTARQMDVNLSQLRGGTSASTIRVEILSPWDNLLRSLADETARVRELMSEGELSPQIDEMLRLSVRVGVADFKRRVDSLCSSRDATTPAVSEVAKPLDSSS